MSCEHWAQAETCEVYAAADSAQQLAPQQMLDARFFSPCVRAASAALLLRPSTWCGRAGLCSVAHLQSHLVVMAASQDVAVVPFHKVGCATTGAACCDGHRAS